MPEYIFSNKAVEDLSSIWNYTLINWSESQADLYYKMLIDHCKKIAQYPNIGKEYSLILEGLLGLKAGRHIIFYRQLISGKILIIRILHERMELKNRYSGE
jgi:toxin ParE1/3/4